MKNRFFYISSICLALSFTSCNNEQIEENFSNDSNVLKASVENVDYFTRAGFALPDGSFFWSAGDELAVTLNKSGHFTAFTNFAIKTGAGTGNATFVGSKKGVEVIGQYAAYPYANAKFDETNLVYTYPSEYTYNHVDKQLPNGKALQNFNSFNAAMAGEISNNNVVLNHLGGVVCIDVDKMPCTEGKFTFTVPCKITGDFTLQNVDLGKTAEIKTIASEKENTVTINFKGAELNNHGLFYIPVPTGEYANFTVKISNNVGDELLNNTTKRAITIKRAGFDKNDIVNISNGETVAYDIEAFEAAVTKANAANEPTTITIGKDIELTKKITVSNTNNQQITIKSINGAKLIVIDFDRRLHLNNTVCDADVQINGATVAGAQKGGCFTIGNSSVMNGKIIGKPSEGFNPGRLRVYSTQEGSNVQVNGSVTGSANIVIFRTSSSKKQTITFDGEININDGCISIEPLATVTFNKDVKIGGKETQAEASRVVGGNAINIIQDNDPVIFKGNVTIQKDLGAAASFNIGIDSQCEIQGNLTMQGNYHAATKSVSTIKGKFTLYGDLTLDGYAKSDKPVQATSLTVGDLIHASGTATLKGGDAIYENERTVLTVKNYTIGNNAKLIIPQRTSPQLAAKLMILEGGSLTNHGTIENHGTIDNKGTFSGNAIQ